MKNLLCFLIPLLIFVSCDKSTEEDEDITILGVWEMVSFTTDNLADINDDGIYNKDMLKEYKTWLEVVPKFSFHFLESGNFYHLTEWTDSKTSESNTDKVTGTWEINENKEVLYFKNIKWGALMELFENIQKISLSKDRLIFYEVKMAPDSYATITYKRI
ncbi:MAG TPA: hypothetical protein PLQ69_01135 [Paludibacter sp.]|nr:hypothetical protein [Paludibacter sp.]